jgi:hypothetical protein
MDEDLGPAPDPRHREELKERVRRSPFHAWPGPELVSVGDGIRMVGRGHARHLGHGDGLGRSRDPGRRALLARASAAFIVLPAPGAF